MMNWVQKVYKLVWSMKGIDCREIESVDKEASDQIEAGDPETMKKILEEACGVISRTELSSQEWAKYKYSLVEWEVKHNVYAFKWPTPHVGVRIDWSLLEGLDRVDQCRCCCLLSLALEDAWFGPNLPSIWTAI